MLHCCARGALRGRLKSSSTGVMRLGLPRLMAAWKASLVCLLYTTCATLAAVSLQANSEQSYDSLTAVIQACNMEH